MEYIFQTTPLDAETLVFQVSRGLERRTELVSREKYPGMWRAADQLRAAPKISLEASRRRRKSSRLLGALCLALGIFAFVPGVVEPRNLPLLLAGGLGIVAGLVSLLGGRRRRKNPFDAAARTLLEGQNRVPAGQTVLFSEEGMTLAGGPAGRLISYDGFERVLDCGDVLLVFCGQSVIPLQKRDLAGGDLNGFQALLSGQAKYEICSCRDSVY
ncbi:YcxB family protein [Oscillospiraceae bacterium 50-60]